MIVKICAGNKRNKRTQRHLMFIYVKLMFFECNCYKLAHRWVMFGMIYRITYVMPPSVDAFKRHYYFECKQSHWKDLY